MNEAQRESIENFITANKQTAFLAKEIASKVIPIDKTGNQYFFDVARIIVEGVITALIITQPDQWNLRDIIDATRTKESLELTLSKTEETKYLIDSYFGDKAMPNILSVVHSHLAN